MVVMFVMVAVVHMELVAIAGNHAADVLKLNRIVVEMKPVSQQQVQAPQDPVTLRRRHIFNQHMATQSMGGGTQAPNVQIVNIEHTLHGFHG